MLWSDGYTIDVFADAPGDVRVTYLSHTPTGRQLDLNVFYVGVTRWNDDVQDRINGIFETAGISVNVVRHLDVTGELIRRGYTLPLERTDHDGFVDLRVRYGVLRELPALLRLSAGAANVAVNVFVVRTIDDLRSLSACNPGTMGMHGTGASGIVVEARENDIGRAVAHELGHFLGLFHPVDVDGIWNPMTDLGIDEDNLMFAGDGTGTELSEQQRDVLLQALVLQ